MFEVYGELLRQHGFHLPAQVTKGYLHYDPYTWARRRKAGPLARQRMDFLMLLRGRRRTVIEIDGIQHYAVGKQASPERYAAMVAEERRLYLDGYEVVRFGGDEFRAAESARTTVNTFLTRLLTMHGYLDQVRQ